MRYLQPTFTLPASTARISQTEYEIRVGLRCPDCEGLMDRHIQCGKVSDLTTPVHLAYYVDYFGGMWGPKDTTQEPAVATITHYADRYPAEKNRAAAKFLRNIDPSPRKGF